MGDERRDDAADRRRAEVYSSARIGAAAALTLVLVVLLVLVLDVAVPDHDISPGILLPLLSPKYTAGHPAPLLALVHHRMVGTLRSTDSAFTSTDGREASESGVRSADQDGAPSAREIWGSDVNTPSMTAIRTAPRAAITRPRGALTRPRIRSPHQVAVHRPTTTSA
jgi:hypothetical protein